MSLIDQILRGFPDQVTELLLDHGREDGWTRDRALAAIHQFSFAKAEDYDIWHDDVKVVLFVLQQACVRVTPMRWDPEQEKHVPIS